MQKWKFYVTFHTPAFLGDSDQSGQWRTPPFKAQLRRWWRVVYAADKGFIRDHGTMRREEGLLFGNAWLSHKKGGKEVQDHCRSQVQLQLGEWRTGKRGSWDGTEVDKIFHPEVEKTGHKVGPHAYLGYGPLDGRGGTKLSRKYAIDAGETAELRIRVPKEHAESLRYTLALMNAFGAIGSRCRNGWGAYSLEAVAGAPELPDFRDGSLRRFFRPWRECLNMDWPHAIGSDDGKPLIWTTEPHSDWRKVMRDLALVRMGVRTQFVFTNKSPDNRHWLAYPVTKHPVSFWGRNSRLPNTLWFTVRPAGNGGLQGVIFHMPCKPPEKFKPDLSILTSVWQTVHKLLDELTKSPENRYYEMIDNLQRREKLSTHLNTISLRAFDGGR